MKERTYDESNIEHFEGMEAVRQKPTMYIGGIMQQGTFHLYKETIGNAIDEFTAGRATMAHVIINSKEQTVTVIDDANGMPIGKFEDIITKLHTSGKYDKSGEGAYEFSLGTFGLGIKLVNALSETFEAETFNAGKRGYGLFHKGVKDKLIIEDCKDKNKHGTRITYRPDITVLLDIGMDLNYYKAATEMLTFITPGFRILFEFDGFKSEYYHPEGMQGYLKDRMMKSRKIRPVANIISFKDNTEQVIEQTMKVPDGKGGLKDHIIKNKVKMTYEVHFTWANNAGGAEVIESYANSLRTVENGTHVTGFRSALTKSITKYIQDNNLLPKNSKFSIDGNDVREALVGVIVAQHNNVLYSTQTKTSVSNPELQYWMASSIYNKMNSWLSNNKQAADAICKVIIQSAKARQAAKDAKDSVIKANSKLTIGSVDMKKFSGCKGKDPTKNELFIVEGDSAKGSAKEARDTEYQAVFAVRGKGQNVFSSANPKLSEENAALVEVMGCGIGPTFDIKKLRFHKIVLAADADNDGANIRLLLSGFFFKYYIPIIEAGYLYEAIPPLFQIDIGKGKNMRTVYLPDQASFDLAVTYIAQQSFDLQTISGKKLSKDLAGLYIKRLAGYKSFIELYAAQTGIEAELLEYIVRYYNDICELKFKKLNALDYDCTILSNTDSYLHINIDRGYEHYFVVLDSLFYNNVYLPIAKRLSEIQLMDIVFVGKNTGIKYGGSLYRNSKFIEGILVNKNTSVGRLKGLGESNASQLREYMFAPETRTIRRITMQDERVASATMDMCLGHNIEGRKTFCMNGNSLNR